MQGNPSQLFLLLAILVALGATSSAGPDGEHTLAHNGQTDYVIAIPAEPGPGVQFMAKDMARILKTATGAEFPVVAETKVSPEKKGIYIGHTDFAAKHGINVDKLARSERVFKSVGDNIVITGSRQGISVDRFAVYNFLEMYLGCSWMDETTEIIPETKTVRLPRLDVRTKAAFGAIAITTVHYAAYAGDRKKQHLNGLFRVRSGENPNRGGSPRGCHSFYCYSKEWPFKPEEHPEYYSMNASGKRRLPKYDGSKHDNMYGHLCLSNPEVPKLLLQGLREFVKKDQERDAARKSPPREIYDISQNDPGGRICCCPKCMEIVDREGGTDSALLLHALNPVAEAIRKEHPHIRIQTFAYKRGIWPPKTLRPADGLRMRFADLGKEWVKAGRDQLFPITHPINKESYDNLTGWGKMAKGMAIWGYWCIYREKFQSPYVITQCMKTDLDMYKTLGIESIFIELDAKIDVMSFFALTRWVGYKMMQDPDQPIEPLIKTFMAGYYGPAAQPMEEYLHYLERRILAVNSPLNEISVEKRPYLDLDFFVTVQGLLDKAEHACAEGSPERFHVKRERVPADCALLHMWEQLKGALPPGGKMPFDRQKVYDRYKANRVEQARAMLSEKYYKDKRESDIEAELKALDPQELARVHRLKSAPPPTLNVKRIAAGPGGDPEKIDWSAVAPSGKWHAVEGAIVEKEPTVKAVHDDEYLYIRLTDPGVTKLTTGSQPWLGDDWEVFLAPERTLPYYQIAVDPKGGIAQLGYTLADGKKRSGAWASGSKIVSHAEGNLWTVSMAIPLKGDLSNRQKIFANFFRTRTTPKESLGWSPTFSKSFHDTGRMGTLVLQ